MEKGIECGIRITKNALLLPDAEFESRLEAILPHVSLALQRQREIQKRLDRDRSAKSGDAGFAAKTVEFYFRTKDAADIVDPLSKGIECSIRIKQCMLELSDAVFDTYANECLSGYRTSILEQRNIFVQMETQKSIPLDDAMKGVELYYGIKSFCG